MTLCKYKDVFGRPKEGAHALRAFDVAVVDVALTLVLAAVVAAYFQVPVWKCALALFVLGIAAHRAFCVRTTVDKWLFPSGKRVRFSDDVGR
jgi:hypothetical protein